jgi:hypothetical protein
VLDTSSAWPPKKLVKTEEFGQAVALSARATALSLSASNEMIDQALPGFSAAMKLATQKRTYASP